MISLADYLLEKYEEGKIMGVAQHEKWQGNSMLIENIFYLKITRHAIIFD